MTSRHVESFWIVRGDGPSLSVYAPHVEVREPAPTGGREITTIEALNEALRGEMQRDGRVFVMGEDVGLIGGIFGVTRGLRETFGEDRVRYMLAGRPTVPLVIRSPQGGGIRLAAQHSQSLEAWFVRRPRRADRPRGGPRRPHAVQRRARALDHLYSGGERLRELLERLGRERASSAAVPSRAPPEEGA